MLPTAHLLAELVRRPSVNPMGRTDLPPDLIYEHRVTDFLETQLIALAVPYRRESVAAGRDNLVAEYRPPTAPPFSVMWEAHQDTVPVDGMVIDPFGAKVEGGKLYGRGACDVKAGGVAMLSAFARLVREKPPGSGAVTLAFTVDEEHSFLGIRHLMASGVRADCAVVAEPTGLNIVDAHKGVAQWHVETAGTACHSSRPDRGVNAIYRMARLVRAVEEYASGLAARQAHPRLGPPSMSVGMIHGGTSANTVPDRCRIDLDRRLVPGETPLDAAADLDSFLGSHPGIVFPFEMAVPKAACGPLDPIGSEDVVRRLGRAIDAVVGRHEVQAVPYGTDASAIAEAGIPAVVFGPGDIAQAHTKDEWVELAQVDAAADVLFRFACGG